jgi:hypothetical protein
MKSLRWTGPTAIALLFALGTTPALANAEAIKKWAEGEFQPTTLSKEDQIKELEWFAKAAEPFKGMEINVLSETIPTHEYESKTLTKAFEEITGIKVNHQLLAEGEVVQAVQTQMQTNRNLYDAYINDSDLIGTHSRLQSAVNMTSSASRSPPGQTASSGSCPTSSSPTSTGSARTGSTARTCRTASRPSTAMRSACRSTGRPMRTSPTSSPTR